MDVALSVYCKDYFLWNLSFKEFDEENISDRMQFNLYEIKL